MSRMSNEIGCSSIKEIIEGAFRQTNIPASEIVKFYHLENQALYSLRMKKIKLKEFDRVVAISKVISNQELETYKVQKNLKSYKKSIFATCDLLRASSTVIGRGTFGSARAMISELTLDLTPLPRNLQSFLGSTSSKYREASIRNLTGLEVSRWRELVKAIQMETEYVTKSALELISETATSIDQMHLNAADHLSFLGDFAENPVKPLPVYDKRDSSIKLSQLRVSGFRGSPEEITIDFTSRGKPSSMLLWGDNGVGKSTIVDGIEFALQGRIDRSADFNSSLRPSARNLTTPTATASIVLSDGSTAQRSLKINSAGRDIASEEATRPGFRIAPIVIRRADILRFLDTETLSRSMIFFDYFPSAEGPLRLRPSEELRMLEEERFTLLILRDSLAAKLRVIRPHSNLDFRNKDQLESFAKTEITEKQVPNENQSASGDSLDPQIASLVSSLTEVQSRLAKIKRTLERGVENLNPIAYRDQLSRIAPVLHLVMNDLTKSFRAITNADHIEAIQVLVAKSGPVSLDILLEFTNGKKAFPQQVFSEAYKDLIALLFFLAVTKKAAEHGQAKVLILDDVLQSVDSTVRVEVMNYILDEFKGWQFIVTGHDRAWFNQLRSLFTYKGVQIIERHITRWSFDRGLQITDNGWNTVTSLQNALGRSDPLATASATGLLLEQICQELSWRVRASVVRRREDRYTLSDLWGGVAKTLRKSEASSIVNDIDKLLSLRNLLGAHYNEWAASISWRDVETLGLSAISLHEAVHCKDCSTWIESQATGKTECRCGATYV